MNNKAIKTAAQRKKTGGRLPGSHNKKKKDNSIRDSLFLYVKKETIPPAELKRFVTLCERFIQTLGPETLNESDIEEIALIYRDRIFMDLAYEVFATAGAIDTTMVNQIDKMNKTLETKKANLGSRFIDRDKLRKNEVGNSFLDLFNNFVDHKDAEMKKAQDKLDEINKNKAKFTSLEEYMEARVKKSSIENNEDEDN
jgi:hypothetical protein